MKQRSRKNFQADQADEDAGSIVSELNITPLTDIFLVLLIIFMVTSTVAKDQGKLDVVLPQAHSVQKGSDPSGVVISLLSNGHLKLLDHEFEGATDFFRSSLKQLLEMLPSGSKTVILEGDQKAFLGSVVQIIDDAQQLGAERFAITASPVNPGL